MRRPLTAILVAAAIGLAACGGGGDSASDSPDDTGSEQAAGATATDAVSIESFEFKPQRISVAAGTTVTWTNGDSAVHSIKDKGDLFGESDDLAEGDTFEHTYDEAGEFPYICGIHQYMTGTVVVEG